MTTALVTGANRGIGAEIARQLEARGIKVWRGSRKSGQNEIQLDVSDQGSVDKAAQTIKQLDILINNAGVNFRPEQGPSGESVDDMRATFEINFLGPVRVTQAFLPLLRHSEAPRIVMMSSGLGSLTETVDLRSENWNVGHAGYCASKTALNMFTVKLAKELLNDGFKVNAADPGLTATELSGNVGRPVEEAAAIAVELATLGPYGPTAGFFQDGLTPHHW
ncbi:SDR family NAD(P)-dependent oxidoreductase [Paractinoplanes lichenicola]|uniref:SDR family NAD(P)-dependent oxidoreductase n=1 Tax=Paractinoplanes lichenicola TaxID=2802976 RepID=A0ABS1VZL0_9ACTN|nr:SDR family NAD(P)-dependent oxidoreductase [Actinoplanes lichenicola]MBL7259928.1 SDR family NAD(P)-dependent oxidoreductase [Actinoplanes lichenicola]